MSDTYCTWCGLHIAVCLCDEDDTIKDPTEEERWRRAERLVRPLL